jgi:ABC-type microcin C transport system duplicated ATPase subunit YejF
VLCSYVGTGFRKRNGKSFHTPHTAVEPKHFVSLIVTSPLFCRCDVTAQLVQDAITKLMANRTVIIIAHRLSTVKDADVIAVFGKGKIIDAGRHEELLRTSKTYANLVRKQLSGAHSMQGPLAEEAVEGEGLSGEQVVTLLEEVV